MDSDSERFVRDTYAELRRMTQHFLLRRSRPATLQATAVVHEAYLRLVKQDRARFDDRQHFLRIAARVVRRVLVDLERERRAAKRGGDRQRLTLDSKLLESGKRAIEILDLNEALEALSASDERAAEVVDLRFFGGLSMEEVAQALDVSLSTIERDWRFARAYLFERLFEE